MVIDNSGWRPAVMAATRTVLVSAILLASAALSACTTAEGTNALVDPSTFEREVMTSTLQGLDIVPKEQKAAPTGDRGPLVLPKNVAYLPPPAPKQDEALPVNSDQVQISTAGLTEADLQRLRNARVVDLQTLAGRPLTPAEQKQLTARMKMANMTVVANANRPLDLPPASYFTNVGGKATVCKAANGELVPLDDPRCPEEIRKALKRTGPQVNNLQQDTESTFTALKNGTAVAGQ